MTTAGFSRRQVLTLAGLTIGLATVGPGRAPVAAAFTVSVDPRLVRDINVAWARLNGASYRGSVRLAGITRTESVYQTVWRTTAMPDAGEVLDIGLRVTTLTPDGALETIKHPLVTSTMGAHLARRSTGAISFTRADSNWQ